ncbi:hypothetical protein GCM10010441_46350 [Kitasatospora paracochleata]|nr:DUF5994 family protein [Kitasatospora paracochleata]
MKAILDRTITPSSSGCAVRLSLTSEGLRPGRLDGAWWPRCGDLLLELPALAAEIDERWGRITRITVNPAQWPVIPRRIPVAGHVVHAGWFTTEQDKHMIMVRSYAPRRLDLLVVPPQTDAVDAARLMVEAADPANTRTASELLAMEPERRAKGLEPLNGTVRRAELARTQAAYRAVGR